MSSQLIFSSILADFHVGFKWDLEEFHSYVLESFLDYF